MHLNVKRTELIAALEEKREEVTGRYSAKIARIKVRIDALTPAETVDGWFREVADLVRDGSLRVEQQPTMSSGRGTPRAVYVMVRDAKKVPRDSDGAVPEFPNQRNQERQTLERDRAHYEGVLAQVAEPFDAALKILRMSEDDNVGIQDGDYTSLLAGKVKGRRRDDEFDDDYDEDDS